MNSLKIIFIILIISNSHICEVLQITKNKDSQDLSKYAMKRAAQLGISRAALINGLENYRNSSNMVLSRKLSRKKNRDFEFQKRRDEEQEEMVKQITSSFDNEVLEEEKNEEEGPD